jgi:hypothetical protein
MLKALRSLRWIPALLAMSVVFASCDLFGSDESPQAENVVVIGTQVGSDFQREGTFGLSATPLDPDSNSILSEDVNAEVNVNHPNESGTSAMVEGHIDAVIDSGETEEPSGNPLIASLNFDASSSLDDHDEPERHRVEGGKAFIDELESGDSELIDELGSGGPEYEAAVFQYSGSCIPDPENFSCTRLLQDFTSDPVRLRSSIEQVGSFGETPTYGSLFEVLEYSESARPSADYEKAILLFSDGLPNDKNLQDRREAVCREAAPSRKDSPIFAVGLGPGSDLDRGFVDPDAVEEMNRIANCSGGTYNGIDPDTPRQSAVRNFSAVGTASSKGFIRYSVRITSGLEDFETGDILQGTLRISSGGESAESSFSFRVPAEDMSSSAFHYSR